MLDCLIIGFNDSDVEDYVALVKSMGEDSGAYQDLDLALIELDRKPLRSLDVLNRFYYESGSDPGRPFHNADFLWPVVLYLGTFLSRKGYTFDYINLFHREKDKLKEILAREEVLTIAITTTLYVSPHPILEIMSFIREHNRTAKVVIGGPYVANQTKMEDPFGAQRLFKYLGADFYVISQEGEMALANIIKSLKEGEGLDRVDNIAYKDGGRYKITAASVESNALEENMVNYSLFPREEINQFISTRTAKSCPFACAFCGFPERAGKYTYQGVDHVEQELSAIRDVGTVTTLTFLDDTFNVPKARFRDLLRMMIKNDYGFKWNCFYRCDHGDEETIELMGEAGCEGVFLGVESGSDQMLQRMNKTARQADYMRAIPALRAAGISTYASLIIGFPGETAETVQETIDFIEESGPDFYRAQLWYADPITPIWRQRDLYEITGGAFNWSHATMDSKTACDWIDRIFLCVENSIWLPQFGFEQWSTFYLQRRGMALARIKDFLKCFNAVKKEQIVFPERRAVSPELLESLRASCRFHEPQAAEMKPVEAVSGLRYLAAERFWADEFRDGAPNLGMSLPDTPPSGERTSVPCLIDQSTLESTASAYQADPSEIVLAAYGIMLSHLSDREGAAIVSLSRNEEQWSALPLRLSPGSASGFEEYLQKIRRKIDEADRHGLYASYLLTNRLRASSQGYSCPVLDVGYAVCEQESDLDDIALPDASPSYPEISRGLKLILKVIGRGRDLRIHLSYPQNWPADAVERLGLYLADIVNRIARKDKLLVGEGIFDSEPKTADAAEIFNF